MMATIYITSVDGPGLMSPAKWRAFRNEVSDVVHEFVPIVHQAGGTTHHLFYGEIRSNLPNRDLTYYLGNVAKRYGVRAIIVTLGERIQLEG